MAALKQLEEKLDEAFVKNAPFQLPKNVKDWIVRYLPYFNLFFGIVSLWAAWGLYQWTRLTDKWVDYANNLSASFGVNTAIPSNRLNLVVWLALITLAAEAVLWIAAFPGTKERKKKGWDLLFYALIVNIIYGVIMLFSDYGGIGTLFGTIVSAVIGLYFLFQIRSYYNGKAVSAGATKSAAPKESKTAKTTKKK